MTAGCLKLSALPLSAATLGASLMLAPPADAQSSSERVLNDLKRPSVQRIKPEQLQQKQRDRNPKVKGFRPDLPGNRLDADLLRSRERVNPETAEEASKRRKREECYKSRDAYGVEKWIVTFRGIEMSATGSDVDEIYGKIEVAATGTGYSAIWLSDANVNVGRRPVTQFRRPAVKIIKHDTINNRDARVSLSLSLFDEEDARNDNPFKGNDEVFFVDGSSPRTQVHHIKIFTPDCNEMPEFTSRTERNQVTLHSNGNNYIRFRYELKWARMFP